MNNSYYRRLDCAAINDSNRTAELFVTLFCVLQPELCAFCCMSLSDFISSRSSVSSFERFLLIHC